MKLLLHVPEASRLLVALKMGINYFKTASAGEKLEARILVNAQGVEALKEGPPETLSEFLDRGGELYFCANALQAFGISQEGLWPGSRTVPAGIRALVEWQGQGFCYVRA